MKWFIELEEKYRNIITAVSWAIFAGVALFIDSTTKGSSDGTSGGQTFIILLLLAVAIVFTLFAARTHDKEKKAREEKEAQEKAEAEKKRREALRKKYEEFGSTESVSSQRSKEFRDVTLSVGITNFPIYTKVRGVTFDGRQEYLRESKNDDALIIKHTPTSEHPDTMSVINVRTGKILGVVGADLAAELLGEFGEGCAFHGLIEDITGGEDGKQTLGCNFSIGGAAK